MKSHMIFRQATTLPNYWNKFATNEYTLPEHWTDLLLPYFKACGVSRCLSKHIRSLFLHSKRSNLEVFHSWLQQTMLQKSRKNDLLWVTEFFRKAFDCAEISDSHRLIVRVMISAKRSTTDDFLYCIQRQDSRCQIMAVSDSNLLETARNSKFSSSDVGWRHTDTRNQKSFWFG